jgi:hypothetical protein
MTARQLGLMERLTALVFDTYAPAHNDLFLAAVVEEI